MQGLESAFPGYFIAATALHHDAVIRPDGCAPSSFVDSETVPFFVLPRGNLGIISVGDIVVASYDSSGINRVVYGVVGDIGSPIRLGEGSIALNSALLGKSATYVSRTQIWQLDIDGSNIAVLVLGGTRHKLQENYSLQNIEAVARAELANWSQGNPLRLKACAKAARVNSR
jgi:hypothetical protein